MTRVNALSKELGVSNQAVLDALKKTLGVTDKTHSSSLSADQIRAVKSQINTTSASGEPSAVEETPKRKVIKASKTAAVAAEEEPPAPPPTRRVIKAASITTPAPTPPVTDGEVSTLPSASTAKGTTKSLPPRLVIPQAGGPKKSIQSTMVNLPTATNTSKGEVKAGLPGVPGRTRYVPPPRSAITVYTPTNDPSVININNNPAVAPVRKDLGRINLPTQPNRARPGGAGGARPGGYNRPGGAGGARPGGYNRPGGPRPGGPRPGGSRPGGSPLGGAPSGPIDPNSIKGPARNIGGKKKTKKEIEQEERELKIRQQPYSKAKEIAAEFIQDEIGIVMLSEGVTVKELAEKCKRPAKDVMAKLFHRGIFATINQPLETELAKTIAREFGFLSDIVTFEEDVQITAEESEVQGEKRLRAPVVTIMGHVDHGKTSLLDAIRTTKVASGEAGGITQQIGAYHVELQDKTSKVNRRIVFIDTPGHEAFTKMRARGAKVTDIAILVVAADDGVMPQTIESISHAKAANVPIIVAINKVDKSGSNPDKVQQGLLQHNIQTETYGGDVPAVLVSAKTKVGLEELLDTILLMADLKELKAVFDADASGSVLEGRLDKGRGSVATVLVQQGTLRQGDVFIAGSTMGRVRAMFDDRGREIKEAEPSTAVLILGFESVPSAGDKFQVIETDDKARTIVGFRQEKLKQDNLRRQRVTLENIFSTIKDGQVKEMPLIVKGDTQGGVESLVGQLEALSTERIRVRILHSAVGTVNENDVILAEASQAIIMAFNTKAERNAVDLASKTGVDLRFHDVIYRVTEEVQAAMIGMLDATEKEVFVGKAEVRQLFKSGKLVIAGSFVTDGKIIRSASVRVLRDQETIHSGKLVSLKRFKDDVSEVKNGLDCGVGIQDYNQLKEGDILEFFTTEKVLATSLD